jgi:hypothetical protein
MPILISDYELLQFFWNVLYFTLGLIVGLRAVVYYIRWKLFKKCPTCDGGGYVRKVKGDK